MTNQKIFISKQSLYIAFLLFPFFISNQMMKMFNLNILYDLWRIVDFSIIIYFFIRNRTKPTKFTFYLSVLWIWLAVSSIISGIRIYASIMKILTILTCVFLVDYYTQKSINNTLNGLMICFEIFIYSNLIAIILFPQSFAEGNHEKIWLLDNYAAQGKWFFPGMCVAISYCKLTNRKRRTLLLVIAILFSTLLSGSATLLFSYVLMALLAIFIKKRKLSITIWKGILCELIFFAAIVILRLQKHLSFILVNLLQRDLTFTGRTLIWDNGLLMSAQRPITGYGYWSYIPMPQWRNLYTSIDGFSVASHAHCQLLHFFVQGGAVFVIGFILLHFWYSKILRKRFDSTLARWISLIIFIMCIMGFVETVYDSPLVFVPYIIGYCLFSKNSAYPYLGRRQQCIANTNIY